MDKNFDDLLIENDLKKEMQKEMANHQRNIKKMPKELAFQDLTPAQLFSKNAFWKVFNRRNYTNSLINGIQTEAHLAQLENTKKEIIEHKTDCFLANHLYIEFYKFSAN